MREDAKIDTTKMRTTHQTASVPAHSAADEASRGRLATGCSAVPPLADQEAFTVRYYATECSFGKL